LERRPAVIALNDCWPSLLSEGGRFLVGSRRRLQRRLVIRATAWYSA